MKKNNNPHAPPPGAGKRVSSNGAAEEAEAHMNSTPSNDILAALSNLDQLGAKLRPVRLEIGEILYEPEQRVEHVYFPTAGVISLLAAFEDGSTVEAGLIGPEGMLGTSVVLGAETTPHQALVQADGHALKMTAGDLRAEVQNDGLMLNLLLRYTHTLFTQVAQTAACNRAHTLGQRLARWLLLTHDRVQQDEFQQTQEFLSRMLGVRRAGVSVAANTLRDVRAIDYRRGNVIVLDRKELEKASCECYQVVKAEYARVFKS
jgi:CRP-like cAMP-binding protein